MNTWLHIEGVMKISKRCYKEQRIENRGENGAGIELVDQETVGNLLKKYTLFQHFSHLLSMEFPHKKLSIDIPYYSFKFSIFLKILFTKSLIFQCFSKFSSILPPLQLNIPHFINRFEFEGT